MNFQTMSKQRKFILIAALAGVIGTFLPWVSLFGFSVNGLHGEGVIVFLCFIVCGIIALMGDQTQTLDQGLWVTCFIIAAIGGLLMLINFLRALDYMSAFSIGFYLTLLASLALVFVIFKYRTPGHNIKSGVNDMLNRMKK